MTEITLKEIAESIDARLIGDNQKLISGVSSINKPKPGTVTFADKPDMLKKVKNLENLAVIVKEEPSEFTGNFLIHPNPRIAFAHLSFRFNPPYWLAYDGISNLATIEEGADIAASAVIQAGVFIGRGAVVEENVRILPNVFLGRGVRIGKDSVILPGARLLEGTQIGERVIINSNVVIGSEGFGFSKSDKGLVKAPQVGGVVIEDDVEIGAGCCIDRGTIDDTIIGAGTKLDNMVQIGHNVKVGRNVRIAAQAGLSGRVEIEDDVVIGGQAGFQNGIKIGKGSRVAGQAGVFKSVQPDKTVSGYPAMPHGDALILLALFKRLPEMLERINALEQVSNA